MAATSCCASCFPLYFLRIDPKYAVMGETQVFQLQDFRVLGATGRCVVTEKHVMKLASCLTEAGVRRIHLELELCVGDGILCDLVGELSGLGLVDEEGALLCFPKLDEPGFQDGSFILDFFFILQERVPVAKFFLIAHRAQDQRHAGLAFFALLARALAVLDRFAQKVACSPLLFVAPSGI